jgi:uncharacterized membrane protein YccC
VPDPVLAVPRAEPTPPRRFLASVDWSQLVPRRSRVSALRAVRATLVVPGLFAFTDKAIGNLQMATFAAFGGFATLVLANFGGTRRDKAIAHLVLAVSGSVLLAIGTAVSASTAAAALVTVPVTFMVFFAAVAGPNAASGVTAALLAYVLPAASAGTADMIPSRLAGWWMASVLGTIAVLTLSPPAPGDRLRATAADTARALSDALRSGLRGDATPLTATAVIEAKTRLLGAFTSTPYRPTGLATADQALANVVELLEWASGLVRDCIQECGEVLAAEPPERDVLVAAAAMLDDVAALMNGSQAQPDFEVLQRLRRESLAHLARVDVEGASYMTEVKLAFHAETIALAVRAIAADALICTRRADPDTVDAQRYRWYGRTADAEPPPRRLAALRGIATVVTRQASLRSVWFLNSVRGAIALAAAVAVADITSVQHGFWVVLGTLSVLRTNAASTGSTALRALLGTVVGFVLGAALISAIGTSETALWIALPITVLIASYAPGAAPFEVGQAAFTVLVSVLFNLIVPVGSKIDVVRIEDVALGCAVSALVGLLFWPRGAAAVVGDDLADAFRRGADYLRQAVGWALSHRELAADAGVAASTAGTRIDGALRAFLAEQGTKRVSKEDLWHLVGATQQLRMTAQSLTGLAVLDADPVPARDALIRHADDLVSWYQRVAENVGRPRRNGRIEVLEPPPPTALDGLERAADHRCVSLIWVDEHLRHLAEHAPLVVEPAMHVAEQRRASWWH